VIFARKSPFLRCLPRRSAFAGAVLAMAGIAATPASAQDYPERAGTAEFQYLETLVFARPAGLAGTYTSLAQGLDAVGYNPAGVSKSDPRRTVAGTFRYHFLDVTSGNATYGFPGAADETGSQKMSYAFSAAYINFGRIEEKDETGVLTGKEHMPVSFNPSFTAARKTSDNLRLGATAKGTSEYLADYPGAQLAVGWALDVGMLYQPNVRNMGFGLALLNLGRKVRAHTVDGSTGGLLPLSLKGGMFYFPLDLPKAKVAVDAELPWFDSPRLSGGVEYAYTPNFILRAGSRVDWIEARHYYRTITDERPGPIQGGNALKAAGGFTFAANDITVDYAVQYWYGLSWVHALTVKCALI
jgi:hypothetical protein